MSALKQVCAVTLMGLQNIPNRLGASLVVVVGMACVVGVLVSILSMSTGFMQMVGKTGRSDRAIDHAARRAAHDRWRSAKYVGGLVWREPDRGSLDDETFSDCRLQL